MIRLTLAVAGGRKTQSIVDRCVAEPAGRRVLVLTFTLANQQEVAGRLAAHAPLAASVEVSGWFSFLLRHWVRPYLPLRFTGRRLAGLNFDGDPGRYVTGPPRFLDAEDRAYRRHLSKLAVDVSSASGTAVLDRLSRVYDAIYIDEVQDLNGYDLDVLGALMAALTDLQMVGDLRQAVLQTNIQDPRHKQYRGIAIKRWFDDCERRGDLEIEHSSTTWRSNQTIASFADSIFDASWGFSATVSESTSDTGHDGVFAVATEDAAAYTDAFAPLCLRHSAASAKHLDLQFTTFRMSKGIGVDRVLIAPTGGQLAFLSRGAKLDDTPCCSLYVAVTRARHSVAFVADDPVALRLPVWSASQESQPSSGP